MNINNNFSLLDLEKFNSIKFHEKNHTYKINDEVCPLSVTRFLNLFIPDFDSKKMATHCAKKDGVDVQDVLRKWEYEKDIACTKGTIFHNYIDNYLSNKILPIDREEINNLCERYQDKNIENILLTNLAKIILQFEKFYEYYIKSFYHVKSEFVVGDIDDTKICGTIDNISVSRDTGEIFIIDYKTNKKYTTRNNYGTKLMYPVQHLDECKHNIYSLQTSIYSYIIEKYTNIKPQIMVVWFNEANDTYKTYTSHVMKQEVESLIDHYKSTLITKMNTLTTNIENYILSIDGI